MAALTNIIYLLAAVLFILAFKGLAHPRTAFRGNLLGALGMFLAVVVTLLNRHIITYQAIVAGLVVGAALGAALAVFVKMTAMPQMVALLNGFGGGASVLVAGAALIEMIAGQQPSSAPLLQVTTATALSGLIGSVTFFGSLVAFGKLQGLRIVKEIHFPGQQAVNALLAAGAIAAGTLLVLHPEEMSYYWILIGISTPLGILLVIPIGGADMPVVVCLLNSYSGLAAAATGFVLSNNALVISGSLVGASGIILTRIMCRAMNRSMANVLFGRFTVSDQGDAGDIYSGKVKSTSAEEVAMLFDTARQVVIVPGYGMAVSQSQHAVRDLANVLEAKGITVEFGIHPVAGRMPGHMNVLLAEADIPYEKVKEMSEINSSFEQTDVVLVIGANDVVNPLARTDPSSPIAGMPILNVDKARTVVVIKRSLSPGFAGIANPLFAADNCLMYFGDGKKATLDLLAAINEG